MVNFGKSDKMIKISRKVDSPKLTTDSIFPFLLEIEPHQNENEFFSDEILFPIKNEIWNPLSVLVYPLFHLSKCINHWEHHTV